MSKNIRIRTEPNGGDNHVKFQLNQDFDFLEILSLKISQEDVYRNFYSDYGVVVGRIIINNGVGVPNAKVSIFIPLTDDDSQDPEISELYPYSDITIVNSDGIRYNLLPEDSQGECHTPIGTFPNKNKLTDNEPLLKVYNKYYKYTTTTNDSGDFMLFGVPVGNYIMNVDVDLSDIGIYSQRPYDFIEQGNPERLFESSTKFKGNKNLNNLTQLKNRQVGINIIPFWGEAVSDEVGISRVDIDLNYNLEPKAIFIGALFGDGEKNSVNKNCRARKKLGKVCEMSEGGGSIQMLRKTLYGDNERFDVQGGRVIDDNGAWAYQIPMNLDYMVTNEYGELTPTEDTTRGIPTRANLRFRVNSDNTGGSGRLRTKASYLVPHNPETEDEVDYTFDERTSSAHFINFYWNKIYTVKNFIGRFQKNNNIENRNFIGFKDVDDCIGIKNPIPFNKLDTDLNPLFSVICIIISVILAVINALNSIISFKFSFFGRLLCFIGCIPITCDSVTYKPGCKGSCGGGANSSQSDARDCFQAVIGESLNIFEFDFYNEWLNGSLYSFLLKYKKSKKDEKYCGDGNGDTSNNLVNTLPPNGRSNDGESIGINIGVIAKFEDELYYKPITDKNNKLYATDIYNLGSVFDCDWQGKPKVHDQLIPTTYQLPPLSDNGDEDGATPLEPLLLDITCIKVSANVSQSRSISRLCEIGVGLDEDDNKNGSIDNGDITNRLLRDNLMILNNKNTSNSPNSDFNTSDYINYRDLRKKIITQSFGNSYYFYFGTKPNSTAIDVMNRKYFTTCYEEVENNININGNVTNVSSAGGTDGAIVITINGGSEPYTYIWIDSQQNQIAITKDISNLTKGLYTVIITDDNSNTNSKNFNVGGISELQMSVSRRGSLPNVSGDGIIYVSGISGGVGPYNVDVTGGNGPYNYSGIYGGVSVENLINGDYTVNCTDNNGTLITSGITINEINTLSISNVNSTSISCSEVTDGTITFVINGGTSPYVINLVGPDNEVYSDTEVTGLNVGDYELIVYDSYTQSATTSTITVSDVLPLVISNVSGTITLTNTILGTVYNLNDVNDNLVSAITAGGSSITYTVTSNGTYSFISEFGCASDTISITI